MYKIQKMFMTEDFTIGSGGIPHSFVGSFPENLKYESLATETRLNEDHAVKQVTFLTINVKFSRENV